jgi:hypothetical protein
MTTATPIAHAGELRFDPEPHIYTVNGRRVPSVTQVLEGVGIVDYSKIPDETREMALERGRIVHLCTQYDDELEREGKRLADDQIDPRVAGYVEAWRRFRRETGFTPELIEHRGYNAAYQFAGTLDRSGRFRGSPIVCLLDIKTGTAEPWTRIQLAAYNSFFDRPRVFPRTVCELHKDGTYRLPWTWEGREWMEHFNIFASALNVFREINPTFGTDQQRRTA